MFSVVGTPTEQQLLLMYTRHVIAAYGGNKSHAARALGIDRRSIYRRLAAKAA